MLRFVPLVLATALALGCALSPLAPASSPAGTPAVSALSFHPVTALGHGEASYGQVKAAVLNDVLAAPPTYRVQYTRGPTYERAVLRQSAHGLVDAESGAVIRLVRPAKVNETFVGIPPEEDAP